MRLTELLHLNERNDIYGEIKQYTFMGGRIFIWGTGSVAAGVLRECRKQEIKIAGFFVDTENYNYDPRIGEEHIYQLKELLSTENRLAVIMGHSHYELASELDAYTQIEKVWCLPDITREDIAITKQFYLDHEEAFEYTYTKLADELSRKNMVAYLNTKISGDESHIAKVFDASATYFQNDIVTFSSEEVYLDVGAYDGKSLREFIDNCPSYKEIIAVEVQPELAQKLEETYADNPRVTVKNIGISDYEGKAQFLFDEQSTCLSDTENSIETDVVSLDYLCAACPSVTTIKICIGNTIVPVLKGAQRLLREDMPKLIISAGVDNRALIDYIWLLEHISRGTYRYYLRFTNAMTEALVLFAVPAQIRVTRSSMPPYEEFIERIRPLWDTRWLTNMGTYHEELEVQLKAYLGVPQLSLMVNGHMALEMAIQAMDFPEGGEVITTPFTFISTTHAILRNHLAPVFCDIKPGDYTIDEDKLEELITPKTVAIVPVHVYGNICNVERIKEIADKHGLKVIYDSCHAFGETYKGQGIGCYGDASVFSFHATKVFNTIEGGAVTFSDEELYKKLYNLKNFGIQGEELVVGVGANAKMNEFAAVMGLCNLPEVEKNIAQRKERAETYLELLQGEAGMILPDFHRRDVKQNYGYFPVLFSDREIRDKVYNNLRRQNIYSRKYFYPLTSQAKCFGERYAGLPLRIARRISETVLILPLYPELEYENIKRIAEMVIKTINIEEEQKYEI